jgi:uncharacterized protein YdhG (YjbR/CyaY superfamily)
LAEPRAADGENGAVVELPIPRAAADAVAGFQDDDFASQLMQAPRRRQPGETRADDAHVRLAPLGHGALSHSPSSMGAVSAKKKSAGFTAEEKAAMRARAKELKAAEDGATAVRAALAKMSPADRALGKRFDAIVKKAAPELTPKTWYGMPAYANKDGKVVCFFRDAGKFKERYAMFGFNDSANLDHGSMWPIAFALKKLTAAEEKKIAALVKKAVR